MKSFEYFDETSHLLKHYLLYHKDIKMSDMKYGMRIRNTFRSALERQVGEAVAIDVEHRKGQKLMNSKSEYNRCHIQRINTKSQKEIMKEKEEETAEENRVKEEIKLIRRKKRDMKIEKEMNQPSLKRVCLEIQNENILNWKERRKRELERKEEEEKIDDEKVTKEKRKRLGEKKKRDLLMKLEEEGKIQKRGKSKKWIEEKKSLWRKIREENSEIEAITNSMKEREGNDEKLDYESENNEKEEKKERKEAMIKESVLQKIGDSFSLKLANPPKNDLKSEKIVPKSVPKIVPNCDKTCDLSLVGGGEGMTTLKVKGGDKKGLTPLKYLHPKVGGGEGMTTLKVKGGDDNGTVPKGLTPLKCLHPKVGGGEGVTTIKVKGGDDNGMVSKGLTPLKYLLPKVGGGDDVTTIKVIGGDEKGLTPLKCVRSSVV